MYFINVNWYIALAFCLFFFIGGRQLAEFPGGTARSRRLCGVLFFIFALPAFLFPLAYLPGVFTASPWYNSFRSINRVELFSALIAPAAGFSTYRKPDSPYRKYQRAVTVSVSDTVMRVVKPLAFPFCVLFVSISFMRPLLFPVSKDTAFDGVWADGGVLIQPSGQASGPAALISAMYSLNRFVGSGLDAVKGTYTDRTGTEFWYIARYAANHGYKAKFIKPDGIGGVPVPSVIPVARTRAFIALLGRTDSGAIVVGDPSAGLLELSANDYIALYGEPNLAMALSPPPSPKTPVSPLALYYSSNYVILSEAKNLDSYKCCEYGHVSFVTWSAAERNGDKYEELCL